MVSRALDTGWTPPDDVLCHADTVPLGPSPGSVVAGRGEVQAGLAEVKRQWKFEFGSSGVWIPLDAVTIPTAREPTYKYCFIRYRFFEKGTWCAPVLACLESWTTQAERYLTQLFECCVCFL